MKTPRAILSHHSSAGLLLLIGIVALVLLLLPPRFVGTHDMDALRLAPLSILHDGDIDLTEFAPFSAYVVEEVNGRLLPVHPLVPALLVLPVYALLEFFGDIGTTRDVMLLAIVLFLIMRPTLTKSHVAWAAFFLGVLVTVRLTTLFIFVPFMVALLYRAHPYRRWMLTALLPLAMLAVYNSVFFGSPLSHGYQTSFDLAYGFTLPWWYPFVNAITLLINPSKGIFAYSPFFLFSLLGIWRVWKRQPITANTIVLRAVSVAVFATLLFYSFFNVTHGGTGFGSWYLIDIIPLLAVLLIPVVQTYTGRRWMTAWIALGVWAVLIQFAGVLFFDGGWHARYDPGFVNPAAFHPSWVWDVHIIPEPLYYLQQF